MSRFLWSVLVAVSTVHMMASPASAAPDEDFVVGTGEILVIPPGLPSAVIGVAIDAHSDPSGGSPTGTVDIFLPGNASIFNGPVTCLLVAGNVAIIGFDDAGEGHLISEVVDNGATGSPDTIGVVPAAPGCSPGSSIEPFPLVSGDFVVHDSLPLTSKDQCKDRGWRDFTDDDGHPFENQGECVAFVQHAA